jgi:hypothetical protein
MGKNTATTRRDAIVAPNTSHTHPQLQFKAQTEKGVLRCCAKKGIKEIICTRTTTTQETKQTKKTKKQPTRIGGNERISHPFTPLENIVFTTTNGESKNHKHAPP